MAAEPLLSTGEKETEKVRFGNFEVMNDPEGRPILLGKGTFGRTYQARHCFLDIIVALKIITERYVADPTVRQRFLTEARAVAKLSHPHIARLYDFGEKEGVLHYAMEYCGGGSLADHVAKNGPLPLRRTIEIAQQISGALKCAHTAGFIHRDLKPSNIMLTAQDGPLFAKLIDFGLVQPSVPGATRSFAEDQSADGARFLGTPLFASPEQLREEPMDVRTDLFSLGMTLWFLMAGRAPESGSSAEIAASRLNRESYAARLPATLPPPFRDVLVRLLEKDRRNRFTTAADLFNSLNACAAALGFRQAKDYTEPLAAIDSEDAQATESGALAKLEPIEIEEVTAPLTSEFSIVTRINEDFTGIYYVAEEVEKKGAMSILHVLHPTLLEDEPALDRFRVHIAQLMRVDVAEIVRPKAIKRYSDYVAVISDKPGGTDLLSVLRTEGTVPLVEAAPLLEKIADVCDRLCAARLPGVQLAPGRIYVERPNGGLSKVQVRLCPRFLTVSEATELARMNEPEETSSTMTTDMLGDPARADNMAEHFASLLYRVVAGRNCPVAASISTQAYVAVPGLSEQSNRILALVIARQVEDSSCGKVLREVLNAEGIVHRVPGHPSAGFTERPEKKKAAAKPAVSPPPVENAAVVTPTVMQAPRAPVTPRRLTDVEEEPHVWGPRKLKPIGVGIAALLALLASYMGVKALIQPSWKPRTDVAQPQVSAKETQGQELLRVWLRTLSDLFIESPSTRTLPPLQGINQGVLVFTMDLHGTQLNGPLRPWDVITAVDGTPVTTSAAFWEALQKKDPTQDVELSVSRSQHSIKLSVKPGQLVLARAWDARQNRGDSNLALQLIQQASNQGRAEAQVVLGDLFAEGKLIERDYTRAAELYRKAADQNDPIGQGNLGRLYEDGKGVPQNKNAAIDLYRKAADQGNGQAKENLRRLGMMTGQATQPSAGAPTSAAAATAAPAVATRPVNTNLLRIAARYQIKDDHQGNSTAQLIGEQCGFVDTSGNIVIEPQWNEAAYFFEGLAAVRRGDKFGYIDKSGGVVVEPEWTEVGRFNEGLARVKRGGRPGWGLEGKWGFIDKTGKAVIEPQWEWAGDFSDGWAVVSRRTGAKPSETSYGFIDTSGRVVIEPQYSNAYGVSEGMVAVRSKGGFGFIERISGRIVTNPQWSFGVRFSEGLASVHITESAGKWGTGFGDKTGRTVIPPQWIGTGDFSEGIAAVKQFDGKWGFITKEGKYILEPQFEDCYFPFSHGLAAVKKKGKRVLIDMNGRSAVGDWDYIDRYQESKDSPTYWIVARQDIDNVHVEWLDSSGKRIWASDAPGSSESSTNTVTAMPRATAAPVIAFAPEPTVTRQSSSYRSWTDRLTQFVSDYVDSTGDSNVERAVSFYAPTADILDEGPKNLDQIRQEIVSYNERWPLRQNSIVGDIQVQEHVRDESYTIRFDQSFYAESAARREWSRGKVAVTLEVRIQGGIPEITSLKQRTLERQKGVP